MSSAKSKMFRDVKLNTSEGQFVLGLDRTEKSVQFTLSGVPVHSPKLPLSAWLDAAVRILSSNWAHEINPEQWVPVKHLNGDKHPEHEIKTMRIQIDGRQKNLGLKPLPEELRSILRDGQPLIWGLLQFRPYPGDCWGFVDSGNDNPPVIPGRVILDWAAAVLRDLAVRDLDPRLYVDWLPRWPTEVWFGSGEFDAQVAESCGFDNRPKKKGSKNVSSNSDMLGTLELLEKLLNAQVEGVSAGTSAWLAALKPLVCSAVKGLRDEGVTPCEIGPNPAAASLSKLQDERQALVAEIESLAAQKQAEALSALEEKIAAAEKADEKLRAVQVQIDALETSKQQLAAEHHARTTRLIKKLLKLKENRTFLRGYRKEVEKSDQEVEARVQKLLADQAKLDADKSAFQSEVASKQVAEVKKSGKDWLLDAVRNKHK